MIKVFFLIYDPGPAWDKIALEKRSIKSITTVEVLPWLLITALLEGLCLHFFGKWQPRFQIEKTFSIWAVLVYELVQILLSLAAVGVSSLIVLKMTETFQRGLTLLQVFTLVAYGCTPLFMVRLLDVFSSMHPAVPWGIGVILMMWTFYAGVPRVMQPLPTHAFGVYFSVMIVVVMTSALARLITGMYLLSYMDFEHSWLARRLAHLFGH